MRLEINEGENFIRIDDGIRIQYNLYTILMIMIFIGPLFVIVRNFEDFTPLIIIWFLTLFGGIVFLFLMWYRTTTRREIRMDEIEQVKTRKYFNGTYVRITLKNGKSRELSIWLSEREKEMFLKDLKEIGIIFQQYSI